MLKIKLEVTQKMINDIISTPEFIGEKQLAMDSLPQPKSTQDSLTYMQQLEKVQFLLGMKATQLIYEKYTN